jgi:hypothetical protein
MLIERSEIGERQPGTYIGYTYVFILGPLYQSQLYDMHGKLLTQRAQSALSQSAYQKAELFYKFFKAASFL